MSDLSLMLVLWCNPLSCAGGALASSAGPRVTGTTEQRQRSGESVITEVLLVYGQ